MNGSPPSSGCLAALLCLVLLAGCAPGKSVNAPPDDRLQQLVGEAAASIAGMRARYEGLDPLLDEAEAVLVFPDYTRLGYIIGAGGGLGVLTVRDRAGFWSPPLFHTLTFAGGGLLAGIEHGALAWIILDRCLAERVAEGSWLVDVGMGITVLTVNERRSSTDSEPGTMAVLVTDLAGLYAGVSLEGGRVDAWRAATHAYHGQDSSVARVMAGSGSRRGADQLVQALLGPVESRP